LIGVNTFLRNDGADGGIDKIELMRSTDAEKHTQIANTRAFQQRGAGDSAAALRRLQDVARARGNVFEALMQAVKVASLGQLSAALYEVGGEYRRNM
jgi:methylmalonyl-CoA mutase